MTSEELIERYRVTHDDGSFTFNGVECGHFESFAIGQSSLAQLSEAGIIAPINYQQANRRPDGLIVDRSQRHLE